MGRRPCPFLRLRRATGFILGLWIRWLGGLRRGRVDIEEVLLSRVLGEPFAPRPIEEPLQRQVFFLQAGIGSLQFLGRRTGLFELTLQVLKLTFQLVEPIEHGAKPLLAGGQVIRDVIQVLRHNHMYGSNGAPVRRFSEFFGERAQPARE